MSLWHFKGHTAALLAAIIALGSLAGCASASPTEAPRAYLGTGPEQGYETDHRIGDPVYVTWKCKTLDFVLALIGNPTQENAKLMFSNGACAVSQFPIPAVLRAWVKGNVELNGHMGSIWEIYDATRSIGYVWVVDKQPKETKVNGVRIDPSKGQDV